MNRKRSRSLAPAENCRQDELPDEKLGTQSGGHGKVNETRMAGRKGRVVVSIRKEPPQLEFYRPDATRYKCRRAAEVGH